jgi:putative MFS transporter
MLWVYGFCGLLEKFGRKFVLVTYLLLTAAIAIWFGTAQTAVSLIFAGVCLSFFNLGAWGGCLLIHRCFYLPRSAPQVLDLGTLMPLNSIFMVFFVAIVIGALAVLFLGKKTNGTDPDEDIDIGIMKLRNYRCKAIRQELKYMVQ